MKVPKISNGVLNKSSSVHLITASKRSEPEKPYFNPETGRYIGETHMRRLKRSRGIDLAALTIHGGTYNYIPGTDIRCTMIDGKIYVGSQREWLKMQSETRVEEIATQKYMSGEQLELDFDSQLDQVNADVDYGMELRNQELQERLKVEDVEFDALSDAYVANGRQTSVEERLVKVTVQQASTIADLQNTLNEKELELEENANNMGILENELIELTHLSSELRNRLVASHQRFYTKKTNNDDLPF